MRVLRMLDSCESLSDPDWSVLGDDTTNPGYDLVPVMGKRTMKFDKANGGDDTVHAGMSREFVSLDLGNVTLLDEIAWFLKVSAKTAIAYTWIRMGTDSSNYVEWRYDDSDLLTDGEYTFCHVPLYAHAAASASGATNFKDIKYLAAGVAFDAQTDTLSDIALGGICIVRAEGSAASGGGGSLLAADVATVVSSDPTHAAGSTKPLTMDTDGDLRVTVTDAQGATGATAPAEAVKAGFLAGSTLPTAVTAGQLVAALTDLYGRLWTKAFSQSSNADRVEVIGDTPPFTPGADAALTAAGNGVAHNVEGYTIVVWSLVTAAIDDTVTVRIEGSVDGGATYDNLAADGANFVINSNKTTLLWASSIGLTHTRPVFVSESGGAAVTVTPTLFAIKG